MIKLVLILLQFVVLNASPALYVTLNISRATNFSEVNITDINSNIIDLSDIPANIGWDVFNVILARAGSRGYENCRFTNNYMFLTDDGACVLGNYDVNQPSCSTSAVIIYGVNEAASSTNYLYKLIKGGITAFSNKPFDYHGFLDTTDCKNLVFATNIDNLNGNSVNKGSLTSNLNTGTFISATDGTFDNAFTLENIEYGNNGDLFYQVYERYNIQNENGARKLQLMSGTATSPIYTIDNYLGTGNNRAVSIQVDQYSKHVFLLTLNTGLRIYKIFNNELLLVEQNKYPFFTYDDGARMAVSPGGTYLVIAKGSSSTGSSNNGFQVFERSSDGLNWASIGTYEVDNQYCYGNGEVAISENGAIAIGSYDDGGSTADCRTSTSTTGQFGTVEFFMIATSGNTKTIVLLQTIRDPFDGETSFFGKSVQISSDGKVVATGCPQCDGDNGQIFLLKADMDIPTASPTAFPTLSPSINPSISPSTSPSLSPSLSPSQTPSEAPSANPSASPTSSPSDSPTSSPSDSPTSSPSDSPTSSPSDSPTSSPSASPTTSAPTGSPSANPTIAPNNNPTTAPSRAPSASPSSSPSVSPSASPTTSAPTGSPSANPTSSPSGSPTDLVDPYTEVPPSDETLGPTYSPSKGPSSNPSVAPSKTPSQAPSDGAGIQTTPTSAPSLSPTTNETNILSDSTVLTLIAAPVLISAGIIITIAYSFIFTGI